MRVACVYHPRLTSGWGKFHFAADAFRAIGCDVECLQTLDEVRAADERCDLVLYEQRVPASICDVDLADWLPQRKSIHAQWYYDLNFLDDAPLDKQESFAPFLRIAKAMDIVFVKERGRLDDYRAAGVNAVWMDQGCPSSMAQAEILEEPAFDVVLWGSSRREIWRQRVEDVSALIGAGFKVAWAAVSGEGRLPDKVAFLPDVQPLQLPQIIELGKVALIVDARQDIDGYWSDRIWLAAGAGACCVRRYSIGGGHLPAIQYESHEMLVSIVRRLCGDYQARMTSGAFARDRTMHVHTYENRAREILGHVEAIKEQRLRQTHLQAV